MHTTFPPLEKQEIEQDEQDQEQEQEQWLVEGGGASVGRFQMEIHG